jgi:hypothetical protein
MTFRVPSRATSAARFSAALPEPNRTRCPRVTWSKTRLMGGFLFGIDEAVSGNAFGTIFNHNGPFAQSNQRLVTWPDGWG